MQHRIKEEMKRENSSAEEARYLLKKDDDERRKWGMSLYGMDTSNSNLYDLVLRIDIMTIDDVVGILERITKEGRFDATPESTAAIKKEALLANIHAKIVSSAPRARVSIKDGIVTLGNLDGILKNDASFREKSFIAMKERMQSRENTIVFVSHQAGQIRNFCDRAVWIEEGVVKREGQVPA